MIELNVEGEFPVIYKVLAKAISLVEGTKDKSMAHNIYEITGKSEFFLKKGRIEDLMNLLQGACHHKYRDHHLILSKVNKEWSFVLRKNISFSDL